MMRKIFTVLAFLVSSLSSLFVSLLAQDQPAPGPWPHPYLFGGADLNGGGGYQPLSYVLGGGFESEYTRGFWGAEGIFDGSKKVNDNTGQNSGYTERVRIWGGYKQGSMLFGTGISYSLLHTSLYSKDSWHPRLGFGKDVNFRTAPTRLYAEYLFPGSDVLNGVQGTEISWWIPRNRHWCFRERFGAYLFHSTITDFSNRTQVIKQKHDRSVFNELQLTVMYRW